MSVDSNHKRKGEEFQMDEEDALVRTPSPPLPRQDSNVWRSCCYEIDKRVLLFAVQTTFACVVVVFSMYMLIHSPDCPEQQMYSSLLTLVLGVYLPSPRPAHISN